MFETIPAYLTDHLGDYLDDLRTLVNIDSGSDNKPGVDAVQGWLAERLSALGFHVTLHARLQAGDDLLAELPGNGQRRVVLLGHSDTVFPAGTAAERPMHIDSDVIRGPGVCDMKGGLLSGIYALKALRAERFTDFKYIRFLSVSDEEAALRHSIPLIQATAQQADAVLTLEAARANGDIVTARKGRCWVSVEAFGRAAHTGVEPEKGRNAILALAHHAVALEGLNGFRPGATVNIGVIQGGTVPSVVPDHARMRVDLRAWSAADLESLMAAVASQLEQIVVPDVTIQMELEDGSSFPPMERSPAVARLEHQAIQVAEELGLEVKGASTGGASDASFVAAEGIPVLDGLGPIGGLDHSPDEYILLSSIVPRTALLAYLIKSIATES